MFELLLHWKWNKAEEKEKYCLPLQRLMKKAERPQQRIISRDKEIEKDYLQELLLVDIITL